MLLNTTDAYTLAVGPTGEELSGEGRRLLSLLRRAGEVNAFRSVSELPSNINTYINTLQEKTKIITCLAANKFNYLKAD